MMAAARRRALTRLEAAIHDVTIRGPEGEQKHYDEKGRLRKPKGRERVEFLDYEKYIRRLKIEAGLIDPELDRLMREKKQIDDFFDLPDDTEGAVI